MKFDRACFIVLGASLVLSACTGNRHFRTEIDQTEHPICVESAGTSCGGASLIATPNYLLGFVEFDDLGWLWNREQKDDVVAAVDAVAAHEDIVLVTFAHGWNHNAHERDQNVLGFRSVLDRLAKLEAESATDLCQKPRKVVGVYLGWRGKAFLGASSFPAVLWNWASFPTRKATAHRIGSEDSAELLADLEASWRNARRRRPQAPRPSRFVVVGHSFGTAVVYGGLSRLLAERRTRLVEGGIDAAEFGDLVLLVNPAIEASLIFPFEQESRKYNAMLTRDQEADFHPIFAVLTSEGDSATRVAFPLGRTATTIFQRFREENPPGYTEPQHFQRKASRTAAGHFEPFLEFLLCAPNEKPAANLLTCTRTAAPKAGMAQDDGVQWQEPETMQLAEIRGAQSVAAAFQRGDRPDLPFSTSTLFHTSPGPVTPYPVIRVDKRLIAGHNDIFTDWFAPFLVEFVSVWSKPIPSSCSP